MNAMGCFTAHTRAPTRRPLFGWGGSPTPHARGVLSFCLEYTLFRVRGFRRRAARSGVKVRSSLRALRYAPPLAAGVGTEPGFRWGAWYENRAPTAPPAPQFRSELDISRAAAPSHTQVRTDRESDSRVFWGLPPKLHVRSQPPAVDGS